MDGNSINLPDVEGSWRSRLPLSIGWAQSTQRVPNRKDQGWKWVPALDVNYCTVPVKTSSIAVTVPLLGTSQLGGSSCSRLSVQIGWETPSKETRPS